MLLHRVIIKNIRSFREEVVFSPHSDINVLIGSNGSGKSNLMDIIYMMLKQYILCTYQWNKTRNENGLYWRIDKINDSFGVIRQVLSKYTGENSPCAVDFVLEATESDIANLDILIQKQETLKNEIGKYSSNDGLMRTFISGEIKKFETGEFYEYTIKDYALQPVEGNAKAFIDYLKVIEGFGFIGSEVGIRFNPLLLYISPFRSVNNLSLEASLSSSTFNNERTEITKAYSRSTSSLIKLATLYFSEKRRKYEASKDGYLKKWNDDPDVKFVTESLNRIGYTWDLSLTDDHKNTYIILLQKDGQEFLLNQASSGEMELINFVLGLISVGLSGGIIMVDEPELHLHPQWLAVLRGFFIRYGINRNNQLLIVTHSGTFINSSTYPYITRVYKNQRGSSCIHQVPDGEIIETKQLLHFINATNNEKVFFSDFVVMVEGDTDEIVFKQILSTIKHSTGFRENVEVMQIRGKSNYEKFNSFLKTLKIESCYIGDLDNIAEFSKGNEEIKNLLVTHERRVVKDVFHNPAARDHVQLVDFLKEAIETGDMIKLKALYEHIVSIRTKLKPDLKDDERKTLDKFIETMYDQNIYILKKGDIEEYFPEEYKRKDLDNVLMLTGDKYGSWQSHEGYKALRGLMEMILVRNRILR